MKTRCLLALGALFFSGVVQAEKTAPSLILADTSLLMEVGIPILDHAPEIGVSLARLDPLDEARLAEAAHRRGKCGGFQLLPQSPWQSVLESQETGRSLLLDLVETENDGLPLRGPALGTVTFDPAIRAAVEQVDPERLRQTVAYLSNFDSRYHKGNTPNAHVEDFAKKLEALVAQAPWKAQIDLISHQGTRQNSIRVRIPGRSQPGVMVVLGAHLDSITYNYWNRRAPGADDNASGSANLFEALRILATLPQPERTIDLFWYAGEEGGLIGSGEIARAYARAGNQVVGALQLDMTLFAGDGEFTLGSMTDYTSRELRTWFADLNSAYIGARIIEDKCGYACSDHASWHSNGFRSLMPFESSFDRMFSDLHTENDVISDRLNFKHSAMFSKIAVAFALTLAQETTAAAR
jgi:leucyl aminopeptidase